MTLSLLRADCASCAALYCVAPGFSASADFAIDKAPGQPCPHLDAGFRCSIHARLRPQGFPGCAAYDCFGAGLHITQGTFGGSDWRQQPGIGPDMFASFAVMRQLHELLWYVTEALALGLPGPLRGEPAGPVHDELTGASHELHRLTEGGPGDLAGLDVGALRQHVIPSLRRASELVRGDISPERNLSGSDLIGQDLRGRDLGGPACGVPTSPEPTWPSRPARSRLHRSRPARRGPMRSRPHRGPVPHPVPGRRGPR